MPLPFPVGQERCFLATLVTDLTDRLNASTSLPGWIVDLTDHNLRARASDWNRGTGQHDAGNGPGSILMLAMLLPERFGVPGARPLSILPPNDGIIEISQVPAKSSRGADNRRTNFLEGLLHPTHGSPDRELRQHILFTWAMMSWAESIVNFDRKQRVYEMCRPCFSVPDTTLWSCVTGMPP